MILDHNTTAGLAWNTDGTYGTNVSYEESNIKPEVDKLVSVSKWVDTPRLISAEEIAQITGYSNWNQNWYYLDSNSTTQTAKSQGASKYAWLFDYTNGCTSYGCNTADGTKYTNDYVWGYWTSTTKGTAGSGILVWGVYRPGSLESDGAYSTSYGVRPVISISKSKLS